MRVRGFNLGLRRRVIFLALLVWISAINVAASALTGFPQQALTDYFWNASDVDAGGESENNYTSD